MKKSENDTLKNRHIRIHWWNMGTKTLDFEGNYTDFLKEKNIKLRIIKYPSDKTIKGYRLTIPVGSAIIRFDSFGSDILTTLCNGIKFYLTYLGDKALLHNGFNEYKINWR